MPISAACPTCEHSYNVPDGQRGKRVRCRNCADIFVVGGSKGKGRDDDEVADVELADPDETPSRKKKSAAGTGGADMRDRLDRDDLKPKKKKGNPDKDRDDDDDDDDDDDKPRKKSGDGGSGLLFLLLGIGGVVLLMVVGLGVAVYWATSRTVQRGEDAIADIHNQFKNNVIQGGNNPIFIPQQPQPEQPRRRSIFDDPGTIDNALDDLRTSENDGFMRDARSSWFDRQAPVEARRKEVCDVLWTIQLSKEHGHQAAQNAFCKWANAAQGDRLMELVEAGHEGAMAASAKLQLPKLAGALGKRLATPGADHRQIIKHWEALGAPLAQKEAVKFLNHHEHWLRNDINGLLKRWNTKAEVIVDQSVADLISPNQESVKSALERLGEKLPTEVPARQAAVIAAVKPLLLSPNNDIARLSINVAMTWGTADLAPDFIAVLDNTSHPVDRTKLMQTLARFNTPACRQALIRHMATNRNNFQVTQVIRENGPAFEPELIELLKGTTDRLQRIQLIGMLGEFGTMASAPILVQMAQADLLLRGQVDNALKSIQARVNRPPG